MNSTMRSVENDDVIIYYECVFDYPYYLKCKTLFNEMKKEGTAKGFFEENRWELYNGVRWKGFYFEIDDKLYKGHIGQKFGIDKDKMLRMLKCYAFFCFGKYIYYTISMGRVKSVVEYLERFGDEDYIIEPEEQLPIVEFLLFISTPREMINDMLPIAKKEKQPRSQPRKLKPFINYLVINEEIVRLYDQDIGDDIFVKWFPLYFWTQITFIKPLRATEMLVTPFDCIERRNGDTILRLRSTLLKNPSRHVYYDVDRDYCVNEYKIPDSIVVDNIEKYIQLTRNQKRRFLFQYNKMAVNEMLSLQAFNNIIADFVEERIIGNPRYMFAKEATGIKEFQTVTAGDSRPIAMVNMYFQQASADICRQLAGHTSIITSSNYYSNVSEMILSTEIMRAQKRINQRQEDRIQNIRKASLLLNPYTSTCRLQKSIKSEADLEICRTEHHLEDCMGCKMYSPSEKELDEYLKSRKNETNKSMQELWKCLKKVGSLKGKTIDIDSLLLKLQTYGAQYRTGCEVWATKEEEEWLERKNSQMIYC